MHMGLRARSEAEEGFGSQQNINLGKTIKHSGMCMKRRSEELMLQERMEEVPCGRTKEQKPISRGGGRELGKEVVAQWGQILSKKI